MNIVELAVGLIFVVLLMGYIVWASWTGQDEQ